MWLQSDGKLSVNEIAKRLGLNASTVRGWKSKQLWDELLEEKFVDEGRPLEELEEIRKSGRSAWYAPKGNQRAKGHGGKIGNHNGVGHGAPQGNKNSMKHGAFERFAYRYMEDDEQEVAQDVDIDGIEKELLRTLAFLKARELRLMKRIAAIRKLGDARKIELLTSTSRLKSEKRMGLWEGDAESGYTKQEGTGMYDGEWLDEITMNTPSLEDALMRLEAELSKIQAQKVRILAQLDEMKTTREHLEIERIRAQGENEQSKLANDWVEALLQLYAANADNGGEADG